MPKAIIKGITTIIVLFVAGFVAVGLVMTQPEPTQSEPEEVATTIRVLEVEKQKIRLEVQSQGTALPRVQSELIPEVRGRVQWMSPNLVVGGYFKKDEPLLRIDDSDYRSAVARAQAAVTRAKAEDEHARFELKRMQELDRQKLTSQSSLEAMVRTQRIAEAALMDARITLEQAQRDLWRTEIRAPYDGLVRTERVDLGQYVQPGQAVASIYASDAVEVRLPVADRQLAYLDLPLGFRGELDADQTPEVILSTSYAGKEYQWIGRLVRTEAEIDAKTRMVTAVVRVENYTEAHEQPLHVGLFVNASIKGREVTNVISLPRAALRNQNQVLIVDAEQRLRYRPVNVMRFEQDNVIINAGLESGEIVNVSPIQTVVDGMRVNPVEDNNRG